MYIPAMLISQDYKLKSICDIFNILSVMYKSLYTESWSLYTLIRDIHMYLQIPCGGNTSFSTCAVEGAN